MSFAAGLLAAGAAPGGTVLLTGTEILVDPSDPVRNDAITTLFGSSVAMDGDVLVVGAPGDDVVDSTGDDRGAVYVFARDGASWTPTQKLVAPDGQNGWEFGHSVDVALGVEGLDDFLIVGSPNATRFSAGQDGRVYIFRRTGDGPWSFETQIFPDTEVAGAKFGSDVAIDVSVPANSQSGDPLFTAVVGCPDNDDPDATFGNQGSIHIFQLVGGPPTWQLTHEFFGHHPNSTRNGDMAMGTSVALDGGLIVAGAPYWDSGDSPVQDGGIGVLFSQGNQLPEGHMNWGLASRLVATTPGVNDRLGLTAAISWDGGVALLGSQFQAALGTNTGAVYAFEILDPGEVRNEVQFIQASDAASYNYFGSAVDIDGSFAVIGAKGANGADGGAAYLFRQATNAANSWEEVGKILPGDLATANPVYEFGESVAISGLQLAAGEPYHWDPPDPQEGVVYTNDLSVLFHDGFESGNKSAWSATSP